MLTKDRIITILNTGVSNFDKAELIAKEVNEHTEAVIGEDTHLSPCNTQTFGPNGACTCGKQNENYLRAEQRERSVIK